MRATRTIQARHDHVQANKEGACGHSCRREIAGAVWRDRTRAMIHRAVHGEVPLAGDGEVVDRASWRFCGAPGAWLPLPATPTDDGHRVHLAVPSARPMPDVTALVTVGATVVAAPRLFLRSIAWRSETVDDLFPVLHAELELHTGDRPRLRLVGSYTPPLSVLGAVTDQVVGRHVARDVVGGFVATVARRLVEPVGGGPEGGHDVSSWQRNPAAPRGSST